MIFELFIPVAADRYQLCKFLARTESVYGFMAIRGCVVILRCRTCIYHNEFGWSFVGCRSPAFGYG